MAGFGQVIDPLQDMELENKKAAVELDKLKGQARKYIGKQVRGSMTGNLVKGVKDGSPMAISFWPHAKDKLQVVCEPVPEGAFKKKKLAKLVTDMGFTMYMCGGVGLSAPQVGLTQRIFVADWTVDKKSLIVCINPELVEASEEQERVSESCLSMPGVKVMVARPVTVTARWWTEKGIKIEQKLEGWAARIFQHELEHLDGKLMLERAGRLDRRLALKQAGRIARGEMKPGAKPRRKQKKRRK